jgi:DNA mismatch repair ATPase MutL
MSNDEKYFNITGRNLQEDVDKSFKEFNELTNYLEKYGIVNVDVCLKLWHRGITKETIQLEELSKTEWDILEMLGLHLQKPRVKEMPLVEAGIISADDED